MTANIVPQSVPHLGAAMARRDALRFAAPLVLGALVLALAVRTFLIEPFTIPSRSMAPALESGDVILVNKLGLSLSGQAQRGDILVFKGPLGRVYVKRVMAVGGDRVALSGGTLILNGLPLPCLADGPALCQERLPGGRTVRVGLAGPGPLADFAEIPVPEGQYFMLGDNRSTSADSRMPVAQGGLGLVPHDQVIGRVDHVVFVKDRLRMGYGLD